MNPDQSFIMEQIESLLKMAEQLAKFPLHGPVSKGIEERVTRLEKIVDDAAAKLESVKIVTRPLTPQEERIKARWSELGMMAAGLGAALSVAVDTYKNRKPHQLGKNTKKSIQARKRKFKGVGGNEKWKKL